MSQYSYHSRRAADSGRSDIGRNADHGRRARAAGTFFFKRFGLALLLMVALFSVYNVCRLSADPRIQVLGKASGTALRPADTYRSAAVAYLNSSLLNSNKITADTTGLAKHLKQQFPELSLVSVTMPVLTHRPVIYLEAAQPAFALASSSGTFIIDSQGRAVGSLVLLPKKEAEPLFTVTDQSNLPVKSGTQLLTTHDVMFIRTIRQEMLAARLAPSAFILPASSRELDMKLAGQPYTVKFNLQSDSARQQAGTYLAVKRRLETKGSLPKEYIDVRLDGRAFYK